MAGSNVLEFNDDNFKSDVLDSAQPVLVDFWAPWCGPCRMLAPTVEEIANEYAGKVRVGKVNTEVARKAAIDYRVQALPTLLLFKNGQIADTLMGAVPKEAIAAMLNRHVA
jgi:thioredoxin 1